MQQQGRDQNGKFAAKAELKGDAIALRLPAALDTQVRQAAGWQQPTKEDNAALREWVEAAIRERVEGRGQKAEGYSAERIRAAANRVALATRPSDRAVVMRAFKALIGELVSSAERP